MLKLFTLAILLISLNELALGFSIGPARIRTESLSRLNIEMKGRKVPIDQRGQYVKNQRMLEAQAEIDKNKPTGVPIFKVVNCLKFLIFVH